MSGAPSNGDLRLRDLEAAVARLSARIDALEQSQRVAASSAGSAPAEPLRSTAIEAAPEAAPAVFEPALDTEHLIDTERAAAAVATAARDAAPGWLGLVGRTFIVLGGAFLLRALTNSGTLPMTGGVWLGLVYAALWLVLATRVSGGSSFFHGLSALMVALPLVIEATLSFHVMSGVVGALLLTVIGVVSLGIGWYRRQRTFAMIATLATIATTFVLAIGLSQAPPPSTVVPPVLTLLIIGTTALWVSYARNWDWLPWPAAAAANLGVALVAVRASATPPRDALLAAALVHALLIILYLGSFVIRIVLREREVRMLEMFQTTAVLVLGLGGTTLVAHANGVSASGPALPCVLAGGLLYVQTFTRIAPRRGFGPEFYYLGMTSLALVLVGVGLLFPYPGRPIVTGVGALLGSLVAWRLSQPMLALQGAIAAIVASAQSGLVTFTAIVWLTHTRPWPSAAMPIWLVLAAVLAALLVPRAIREDAPPVLAYTARMALAVALVAGLGSLVVIGIGQLGGDLVSSAGVMATLKTVILAGAAASLARIGRSARFVEFGWLAYGVLALGGLKILFEDLPNSRPSTLFIALAVYGAALILVPRISKKHAPQPG
jgi:hypothetical protein